MDKFKEYEKIKEKLKDQDLKPAEYQETIKRTAEKLEI